MAAIRSILAPGRAVLGRIQPTLSRRSLLLRLGALVLIVGAIGLPINDLSSYAILVVSAIAICTGAIATDRRRWAAAVVLVTLAAALHVAWPSPRFEEGHNVFLYDGPGSALEAGLPPDVFAFMKASFEAQYPPQRHCARGTEGCWRNRLPDRTFAFAADGIWQQPAFSRAVTGIDFDDLVRLRLGFINAWSYNWISGKSDIDRLERTRGIARILHPWRVAMPLFVMYRLPEAAVGSRLCWRGDVLWEELGGQFEPLREPGCRLITFGDAGRRVFGVSILHDRPLAMRLEPTRRLRAHQLAGPAAALIAACGVLLLLVRVHRRRALMAAGLVAASLAVTVAVDSSFIGGVRPFDGGDDGLAYEGWAREIVQHVASGNIGAALRGGESVFYFTPGTRYLRALQLPLFGDSSLGYLSLMLLLPFVVLALFRRFLPERWAVASTWTFVALPIGALFGGSLLLFVKWAARGFGDPAGALFLLAGTMLLVGPVRRRLASDFIPAFGGGLLFALALFVRPNLAVAAGVLLGGAGLAALWQWQMRRLAGLCLGFSPVFGMLLHNWYFGGALVLFTSTMGMRGLLVMSPLDYLAALRQLVALDFHGDKLALAATQIAGWLAGVSESYWLIPLGAAAIALLVRVLMSRRFDPWLRLIAGATLGEHIVVLFYPPVARYHLATWLLTLLVVTVWAQREGWPWLAAHRRRSAMPAALPSSGRA